MCQRKSSKKGAKRIVMGYIAYLSSYKIKPIQKAVKPCTCIIQLTHRWSKRGLEPLPCSGSESTYTATPRKLLPTPTTRSFLVVWIARKDACTKERARVKMTLLTGFEPARARLRAARYSAAPTASYSNPNKQLDHFCNKLITIWNLV